MILLFFDVSAQDSQSAAQDSMYKIFNAKQANALAIYNGRQYIGYSNQIEGNPYYVFDEWQNGSILYEGTWYRDIPLLYDIYLDQVVVKSPAGFPFILISERVQEFHLGGMQFVRLTAIHKNDPNAGFYQKLVTGKATVYAGRRKLLDEKLDGTTLIRKFISKDRYYLSVNNEFFEIDKQKDLFDAMKEKKATLQDYIKKQGLRFKVNREVVIIRLTELYNQSIN